SYIDSSIFIQDVTLRYSFWKLNISSKEQGFQAISSFCDENGKKNAEFPVMQWKNTFNAMGFEAGFTAALGNLDELLAK
ncbi:MAG TPA: hypothetical protein VII28_12475, partial [Puia sp.]